jgi:hypothetical protein
MAKARAHVTFTCRSFSRRSARRQATRRDGPRGSTTISGQLQHCVNVSPGFAAGFAAGRPAVCACAVAAVSSAAAAITTSLDIPIATSRTASILLAPIAYHAPVRTPMKAVARACGAQ